VKDGVEVRDFAATLRDGENRPSSSIAYTNVDTSAANLGTHTPGSWRTLPFVRKRHIEKLKSKSMTLPRIHNPTPTKNSSGNRGRKGLVGRWKKLYRSSSWEIRAYTHHHGHRSSIGAGASAECPDLECVPGIGDFEEFRRCEAGDIDGAADSKHPDHRPTTQLGEDGPVSAPTSDHHAWTRTYRDCVGSLSALKSDAELQSFVGKDDEDPPHISSMDGRPGLATTGLRDSTTNFEARLIKKHEEAKEALITQINIMGKAEELSGISEDGKEVKID
jgi:hypothetical protein